MAGCVCVAESGGAVAGGGREAEKSGASGGAQEQRETREELARRGRNVGRVEAETGGDGGRDHALSALAGAAADVEDDGAVA